MALTHGCCGARNDGPHADGCYINDRLTEVFSPQTPWQTYEKIVIWAKQIAAKEEASAK